MSTILGQRIAEQNSKKKKPQNENMNKKIITDLIW